MVDVNPIRTPDDYQRALDEIERLFNAGRDTPEGDRLEVLSALVSVYEDEHYPVDYDVTVLLDEIRSETGARCVKIEVGEFTADGSSDTPVLSVWLEDKVYPFTLEDGDLARPFQTLNRIVSHLRQR